LRRFLFFSLGAGCIKRACRFLWAGELLIRVDSGERLFMMPGDGRWQVKTSRPTKRNLATKAYAGIEVSQAGKPTDCPKGCHDPRRTVDILLPKSTLPVLAVATPLFPVNR
jgi:hypothetical protein